MPKKNVYARYVIELFDDNINGRSGIGVQNYTDISDNIPMDKRKVINYLFKKITDGFPLLLFSISDDAKAKKGRIQ